jgi:putative hydrolase of HD superfamily
MNEFDKIFELYKLKHVYRKTEVKDRYESTAEHIYSSLILAQVLLKKINEDLDENKIMKMILYHDLCEIYSGDTHTLERTHETDLAEDKATKKIVEVSPKEIANDIKEYNKEFVERKTREAKFAKAIDVLDPTFNEMKNPSLWKRHGFSEKVFREMKEPYIKDFPELVDFFESIVSEFKNRKLFVKQ